MHSIPSTTIWNQGKQGASSAIHLSPCLQVGDLADVLDGLAVHPLLDARLRKRRVADGGLPLARKLVEGVPVASVRQGLDLQPVEALIGDLDNTCEILAAGRANSSLRGW